MSAEGKSGRFAGSSVAYPDDRPTPKFAGIQIPNPFWTVAVEPASTTESAVQIGEPKEQVAPTPAATESPIFEPDDMPAFVGSRDTKTPPQENQFISGSQGSSEEPPRGPESQSEAISGPTASIPAEKPNQAPEEPSKPISAGRRKPPTAVRKSKRPSDVRESTTTSIFHQDPNVTSAIKSTPTKDPRDPQIAFFDPEPKPLGVANKSKEAGGKFLRLVFGVGFGILAGLVAVGYLMVVFGPYKMTDLGLIREDTGIAINALPPGTEVTIVRNGTEPPSGLATLNPIILGVSHVVIDERTQLDDGTPAYQVTCIDGSCPTGITSIVPFSSVIGGPPGS